MKSLFLNPALGFVELSSIANGYVVSDAMVKKAPVHLVLSEPTSSGKYLIMISGSVASVHESLKIAMEVSEGFLLDEFFIPQLHSEVVNYLNGQLKTQKNLEALSIIETKTVASSIYAGDAALKEAQVQLVDLQLGRGIGGKGYFVLSGKLFDVQAAHAAALKSIESKGTLVRSEIVTSTHEDIRQLCI